MSARTIKNPATVSGKGVLSSQTIRITNGNNYCALDSNSTGDLLVNGQPISSGGGLDAVLGGDGISVVTTDGDATVTNDGVLELTAGVNVTITGTKDNYTINSNASGGAVDSIIAGSGIDVSGTTDVTITNTGVLALTAGSNISITGTNDNLTINSSNTGIQSLTAGAGISLSGTSNVTITNSTIPTPIYGASAIYYKSTSSPTPVPLFALPHTMQPSTGFTYNITYPDIPYTSLFLVFAQPFCSNGTTIVPNLYRVNVANEQSAGTNFEFSFWNSTDSPSTLSLVFFTIIIP